MPNPVTSIAAFGESTFRGVGGGNPFDNPYRVPDMVGNHFGLGPYSTIARVDNRAISGRSILEQQASIVQDKAFGTIYSPGSLTDQGIANARGNIVLLNIGLNDAIQNDQSATYKEDFKERIRLLVQRFWWSGRLVLIQTPNKARDDAMYEDGSMVKDGLTVAQRVQVLAQALRETTQMYGLILSDVNSLDIPLGDQFHPTNAGYQLMSNDIINQINAKDGGTWLAKVNYQYQVALAYTSVLLRLPETAGLNAWVNLLESGVVNFTDGSLLSSILNSPEAQAYYPTSQSNSDFIRAIYANALGRIAQQDEVDFWVNQLSGNSRGKIFSDILFAAANYYETSDGSVPAGITSQRLIQSRCSIGFAYAVIFNGADITKSFITDPLMQTVTDDPLTAMNAMRTLVP